MSTTPASIRSTRPGVPQTNLGWLIMTVNGWHTTMLIPFRLKGGIWWMWSTSTWRICRDGRDGQTRTLLIDILYKLTAASKLCSSLSGQAGHGQLDMSWTSPRGCFVPLSRGQETLNLWGTQSTGTCHESEIERHSRVYLPVGHWGNVAFPSIRMPPSAIMTSEKMGMSPNTLYALDLLQTTGICVVPTGVIGQNST